MTPDHSRPSGDAMRFAVVLTFAQRLGSEGVGDPTEPLGALAARVATNLAPKVLHKFPSQGLRSKQVSWRRSHGSRSFRDGVRDPNRSIGVRTVAPHALFSGASSAPSRGRRRGHAQSRAALRVAPSPLLRANAPEGCVAPWRQQRTDHLLSACVLAAPGRSREMG